MLTILYWMFIGVLSVIAIVGIVVLGLGYGSADEYEGYL